MDGLKNNFSLCKPVCLALSIFNNTPSVRKYLSEKWINMDVSRTKIHLDTFISTTSISGRRKYMVACITRCRVPGSSPFLDFILKKHDKMFSLSISLLTYLQVLIGKQFCETYLINLISSGIVSYPGFRGLCFVDANVMLCNMPDFPG